jgi:hypothetical protein
MKSGHDTRPPLRTEVCQCAGIVASASLTVSTTWTSAGSSERSTRRAPVRVAKLRYSIEKTAAVPVWACSWSTVRCQAPADSALIRGSRRVSRSTSWTARADLGPVTMNPSAARCSRFALMSVCR